MNNLFLDLKSTDTFDTALERLEEYGVGSVMFTGILWLICCAAVNVSCGVRITTICFFSA